MMTKFTPIAAALAASLSLATGTAVAVDYTKMSAEDLAEYLIMDANGYKMDLPTQEGSTGKERMVQDEIQKLCSTVRTGDPDADTAIKVNKMARATIDYPDGGITLGDWKKGREIAWSGYGFRVGHKNDNHDKKPVGGNCYNCHQIGTDRTGGSIGPVLTGYGKMRGTSEPVLKYTYEVIYNPHAVYACTHMPRIGANGLLTQEEISHVMAYLLDPESPVNQ